MEKADKLIDEEILHNLLEKENYNEKNNKIKQGYYAKTCGVTSC